jgi:hypothetical protein
MTRDKSGIAGELGSRMMNLRENRTLTIVCSSRDFLFAAHFGALGWLLCSLGSDRVSL